MVLLLLKIPGNMHLPAVLQISFFSRSLDVQIPGARHTDQWPFPVLLPASLLFSYIFRLPTAASHDAPSAHESDDAGRFPAGSLPVLCHLFSP